MKNHCWIRASPSDFTGPFPLPRSGHTAVNIGKSKIVFFGGLVDKKFLNDVVVYDIDNRLWYQPECTGSGSDGQVGPSPRAFHIAVGIDCHVFIFGGRSGSNRLGDFWVLDTDIWQWSELTSFGDLPSPRDFAAASAIGNRKIVMYGGWDGKKWLSDVYVMDTISLEWVELSVSGAPPARCGHSATMIEKRLLIYGGRGGGGPILSDLWALKGLIEEENEAPAWTQLKLPGQAPSPRCGHTISSGGLNLLLFGGHATGGWLSRYDIYYNDCIVLDRVKTVEWKILPTSTEPPPARAYHSMNSVGSRYLLFGGFDGKSTFGDLWWLVPEDDPVAKRVTANPYETISDHASTAIETQEVHEEGSAIAELKRRLEISNVLSKADRVMDESEDKELLQLASIVVGEATVSNMQAVKTIREHWLKSSPRSIPLKELSPLLRDYQRLITRIQIGKTGSNLALGESDFPEKDAFSFYHVRNASQLRLNDITNLLAEYKGLLTSKLANDVTAF